MPPNFYVSTLLQTLAFPPGLSLFLLILAVLAGRTKLRLVFSVTAIVLFYAASIPMTAFWLRSQLEIFPPVSWKNTSAEAIVVLGADRYKEGPEYGGDTVRALGLERLRYAAWLQKKTGLPILTSGGSVLSEPVPEAELMRDVLSKEFSADVRWIEGKSRNTYENAIHSSLILKGAGVGDVLLVTHAWHMARAMEAFESAGIHATAAPTGFSRPASNEEGSLAWLPSAQALYQTQLALHEWVGLWWYRFHYYHGSSSELRTAQQSVSWSRPAATSANVRWR